ncbi:MFS transporter [Goodfellowiella coeruleoviolacea]|uniref:Arabinose efflux permease, MFS family n=1 Tax=Goodfellowiella coeruleoviolacea TaxID=334858 RepID=A0AAE3GJ12_9PSEU|nr:MFS transporter [Goodfellowiella coeruleoviolacea]MCP2169112.1 putative arabinose efflux permease, MFS family [Goodfellowiella coeruleoviolacea]
MPLAVFILGLAVFCLNTTEVMVAGLLPSLSDGLGVSITAAGNLVTVFALGMVFGGPVLTLALRRVPRKLAMVAMMVLFLVGQTIGALTTDYGIMVLARIITALATAAFFGLAASVCANLVPPDKIGRALAIVFGGFMVANVFGLPLATFIDQLMGWRAAFWAVDILVALCLVLVLFTVGRAPAPEGLDVRSELSVFRSGRLWGAFATNALLIGGVFATFAYLSPVLTRLGGFAESVVPLLFVLYGVGTVIGNVVLGRLADAHTLRTLWLGGVAIAVLLGLYALVATNQVLSLIALFLLGFTGLPLNPAMASRVMSLSNSGALINTMNTATICAGITIGTWLAGIGVDAAGYRAPMWVGALLALGALATLLVARVTDRRHVQRDRRAAPEVEPASGFLPN